MKIIFITREGYGLSGARVRCYGFAKELKKLGIPTEVFSFADNLCAKYGEEEFKMSNFQKLRYNILAFKKLIREKDTIFYIQRFNYHCLSPLLLHILNRNKIIFDMDDWDMDENPRYLLGIYPTSKHEFLTRLIAKKSIFCIAASYYLKNYLENFNPRVYYLPTGVDTKKFYLQHTKKNNSFFVFSWIGTVYHKPMFDNIKFIIDCFCSICKKYPEIILEIIGKGKYMKFIKQLVKRLNCNDRVLVKNWIKPDKIPEYLSKIDIGLIPLIEDSKFNIAKSPTKLFEYMAMAKPTVSSNIGEIPNIIKHNQNGLLANNKEEFIKNMERLITDKDLRSRLGRNAREDVEKKYSLEILSKKLFDMFIVKC